MIIPRLELGHFSISFDIKAHKQVKLLKDKVREPAKSAL